MRLRGVLIDFGDTLAHLDQTENRKCEEELVSTLKRYAYERSLKDLASVMGSAYMSSTKGELKSSQDFWGLVLQGLGIRPQRDLMSEMEVVRNNHMPAIRKLYDGVFEALTILRKKYRLALVSNCAVGTDEVIDSLGLADFFSCIILSYQVGVRKPDKRMYLEALRCLKLEAHECIFVADEISDLEGAKETGMRTMLVRQGHSTFQEARDMSFKPDFEIRRISEITRLL